MKNVCKICVKIIKRNSVKKIKWQKGKLTGVRFYSHETRKHGVKFDRYFSGSYQIDGKRFFMGFGWASEGIKEETVYNKLIEFKIIKSRYYKDEMRGQANNIVFRNIDVTVSRFNPGYTISCIGGYNADHMIQNVTFDNFKMNGVKMLNTDELDLYIKQASNITFK